MLEQSSGASSCTQSTRRDRAAEQRKNQPTNTIIYTDSRVSLDSLRNPKNHSFLVEEIRKQVASLERREWRIKFSWVKTRAETLGNEMADRLAKEAARCGGTGNLFTRIPKAHYIKKPEKKPGTNGSESGRAKKLRQPDNTFP